MASILKRAYEAFECNYTCGLSLRKFLRFLSVVGMLSSVVYIAVGTYIIVHIVQTEKVEWFPNAYYRIPLADGPVASRIVFRPPESYHNGNDGGGGTAGDFIFQHRQRQDPYPFYPYQQPGKPDSPPAPPSMPHSIFPILENVDESNNIKLGEQQQQEEDRAIYYRRNVGLFICLAATLILMNFIQLIVDIAMFCATLKSKKSQFWVYFLLNITLWIMTLCCFITIFSGGGIFLLLVFLFGTGIRVYIVYILHELMSDIGKPVPWSGTNQVQPEKEVVPEPRAMHDPEEGNIEGSETTETESSVVECNDDNDDGGNDGDLPEPDGGAAAEPEETTSSTKALQDEVHQGSRKYDEVIEETEVECLEIEKSEMQTSSAPMVEEEEGEVDEIIIDGVSEVNENAEHEDNEEDPDDAQEDVEPGAIENGDNDVVIIDMEEPENEMETEVTEEPPEENNDMEGEEATEEGDIVEADSENVAKHDIGTDTIDIEETEDNPEGNEVEEEDEKTEIENDKSEIKCAETQTSDVEEVDISEENEEEEITEVKDEGEADAEHKSVDVQTSLPEIETDEKEDDGVDNDDDNDKDSIDISAEAEKLVDEIVMNYIDTEMEVLNNEEEGAAGKEENAEEKALVETEEQVEAETDPTEADDETVASEEEGNEPNDDGNEESVGLYDIATEDIAEPPGLYEIATEDELGIDELEEDTHKSISVDPASEEKETEGKDSPCENNQDDEENSENEGSEKSVNQVDATTPAEESGGEVKSGEESQEGRSEEDNLIDNPEIPTNEVNNNQSPSKRKKRSRRARKTKKT